MDDKIKMMMQDSDTSVPRVDSRTPGYISCRLLEVDLEENWAKFEIPQHVMDKGFHVGSVLIDFSGVQD